MQPMNDPFRTGTPAAMSTLSECLTLAMKHGYTENFAVMEDKLHAPSRAQHYTPEEVQIVNFFRFEGPSNPDDMSILYVIETTDGAKGTLIDAYGTYADADINTFIVAVQNIHKKDTNA